MPPVLRKKRMDVSKSPKKQCKIPMQNPRNGIPSTPSADFYGSKTSFFGIQLPSVSLMIHREVVKLQEKSIKDIEYRHEKTEFVEASQSWLKECGSFQIL